VVGFEYGYSLDTPDGLVLWEAQFGDFVNVAQPIIDQFIVSAESKWRRLSGLVMLLPHGFEGMGPEHSSARLERFLALCAEDNIQVAQPTTPAQYFHLLRRQALRRWRKPLVVMTPKSLLRHPKAVSSLDDLASGGFRRILPDAMPARKRVSRVLLCSGKVYYELDDRRQEAKREDVAIVRVEQFYPLREEELRDALRPYPDGTSVVWVQEEPENMGAWRNLRARFGHQLLGKYPFSGVSRRESASPATGSASAHKLEQKELIDRAFA
jgi:2-oxoglutarate dehydrogenase E1 component